MLLLRWLARLVILWRRVWRRLNMLILRSAFGRHGHHFIFDPDALYSYQNIEVGDDVSIGTGAVFLAAESKIIIGNKVMFGPNVTVVGGRHNTSVVGRFMYDVHEKQLDDDQDIIIEDDVWLGAGATILKGVRIGRGSVVAAGALVNKDVLPYSLVGGIPARVIGIRFENFETLCSHDSALYPPEKRLKQSTLKSIQEQVRAS